MISVRLSETAVETWAPQSVTMKRDYCESVCFAGEKLFMMRPNDENGNLLTAERPFRVFIIAGSDRRQYNCPGVDSKARTLMLRVAGRLPQHWEIDYEDPGNIYGRARIQSCNACVSTSMALCVWPCNCCEKHSKKEPDLMWDLDTYA